MHFYDDLKTIILFTYKQHEGKFVYSIAISYTNRNVLLNLKSRKKMCVYG